MKDTHLPPPEEREAPAQSAPNGTVPPAPRVAGANPQVLGDGHPAQGRSPGLRSAEDDIRRRLVEEALVSEQLRNAIEVVLLHFRRRVFRWNELLAETREVLGEVALRALDRLATFDHHKARPLPWLMGIATNVLRERARWYAREAAHVVPQSSCSAQQWEGILSRLSTEPSPPADPNPVWLALERLPLEQQRILRLRFVEDRPYPEIAHRTGISEQAARARLCRALRALRSQLPDESTAQRRDGE
jgi:RNA polymerase sigma factor (sigma-70 family)